MRALSLLLALVMVLGLLPGTVWASKTGITVSLSIFDQGIPGTCGDGALMLQRPVTVEDRNEDGNYSLDEALAAAHAAYYPDGEDVQKDIARRCREAGRPFCLVTQLLWSMEQRPVPTRAEVLDIYNGVLDGASSLMLTGETAVGKYPV